MKSKKSNWLRRLTGSVLFLIAAALFMFGCLTKMRSMKEEAGRLDAQIIELKEELSDEKSRKVEEEVEARYYSSDAYKELLARTRFNLIYEGERLYVIQ